MYRLAATRILSRRAIQTSAPSFVRIRSSNPPPPPSSPSSNTTPSPAERPPAPPPETARAAPPFEPIVSQPASGVPPHPISEPSVAQSAPAQQIPLEQPAPTASSSTSAPPSFSETTDASEAETHSGPIDFSKLPSLDIDPDVALPEPKAEGEQGEGDKRERTGAGRREYVTSAEKQRRAYLRFLLGSTLVGGLGAAWYLGQADPAAAGAGAGSDAGLGGHWNRLKKNTGEMFDIFSKPAFKVLLPDPLPPPHQRPYTLVIDLEGLLVSSSWDRASGWRTAKRPGVDYFLAYLSQFYEIVLFTTQHNINAAPVAEKLDPFGAFVPYKLFREATRTHEGKVVKDLSYLNRDLSKVVMIDTNADHAALQPENAIIIKPWSGKGGERGLVDLIPFLESIAMFNAKDVRPILSAYAGKDIPLEYAKKEAEAKQQIMEEWQRTHGSSSGGGSGWLSGAFGGTFNQSGKARPNQPMTYLDQKRAEAQQTYLAEQKYWKDHEEEFKKMIEEDKQRQMAEMKGSLLGYFGGMGGKKEEPPKQT